jgi:5-methylcytosine-specific restriction endonuclease McrA
MTGGPPSCVGPLDARARTYPASWRDAAVRELFDERAGGVTCPGCGVVFCGRARLRSLHCDHIVPYSLGGLTTWENLQLLCGPCNLEKYNKQGLGLPPNPVDVVSRRT